MIPNFVCIWLCWNTAEENHSLLLGCQDTPGRTVMGMTEHVVRLQTIRERTECGEYLSYYMQSRARDHIRALPPLPVHDRDVVKTPDSKWSIDQTKRTTPKESTAQTTCPNKRARLRCVLCELLTVQRSSFNTFLVFPSSPWLIPSHTTPGSWHTRIELASQDLFLRSSSAHVAYRKTMVCDVHWVSYIRTFILRSWPVSATSLKYLVFHLNM